jgi:hypothetical protein
MNVSTIVNRSNFMTKRMLLTSFAVLALIATASMVMAQPPGGGQRGPGGQGQGPQGGMMGQGMFGGGAMGILMNEEARTALGITEDQIQKLRESMRPPQGQGMQPPHPGQGPPDAAQIAQMREQMQARQAEMRKNLEATLSKEQVAKLDVMVFQRSGGLNPQPPAGGPGGGGAGPGAGGARGGFGAMMINVDNLRALGLTDDQKKKLEEAQEKMMTAMRPQGGFNRDATPEERQAQFARMREAGQKAGEEFQATLNSVLTTAQKAKAEELMRDVPEYLQRRAPGQGGQGQGGNLNNWQPGQGGGQGPNPNREQRQQRTNTGGRQFPG